MDTPAVRITDFLSWISVKPTKPQKPVNRVSCLRQLLELQQQAEVTENEFITVSMNEGTHQNAEKRLSFLQSEYRRVYKQCEFTIKS